MTKIIKDEFNSKIFEMSMGNLDHLTCDDLVNVLHDKGVSYDHLSAKVDCKDLEVCKLLLSEGFYIVDTLVSYIFDYERNEFPKHKVPEDVLISPAEEKDIESLCNIAYNSFNNDRYHNDPFLKEELCNTYYSTWTRNLCESQADIALVAKDNKENILAFFCGKQHNGEYASMVLSAVTDYARGKGIYSAMFFETMKFFRGKSHFLTTGTQINNYAVQKAWNKLGFKIYESKYVLHYGKL